MREVTAMKDFVYYTDKSTLLFRKFISSGVNFDLLKPNIVSFLTYVEGDYAKNLALYRTTLDIDSIVLENVIDAKYRFLMRGIDLKHYVSFLTELHTRVADFEKKEINLRLLLGIYLLQFMVTIKIVETFLGALATYNVTDPNNLQYKLSDIGIDSSVLRYFMSFDKMREKTIDDWSAMSLDATEDKYMVKALKRIYTILASY